MILAFIKRLASLCRNRLS